MAHASIIAPNVEQDLVVIRGLHSIRPNQAGVVIHAMEALSVPWRVECHDDYDGYLSIIVSSDDGDAPTFAITGRTNQIELCEIRDDALHARGCFSTINSAVSTLVDLLRTP